MDKRKTYSDKTADDKLYVFVGSYFLAVDNQQAHGYHEQYGFIQWDYDNQENGISSGKCA